MSTGLFLVQALNGLQLGILLFLVAAGLTLVFGVMDFINLAHGVQYMLGAYLGAALAAATGSFWLGLLLALPAALLFGLLLEVLVLLVLALMVLALLMAQLMQILLTIQKYNLGNIVQWI